MSKNQEQGAATQESIDYIKKQLDEEYKNLSWLQAGYVAFGVETGNKKYDDLNKKYLELNKDNLGAFQKVTRIVGDGISALQFIYEAAHIFLPLMTALKNLRAAINSVADINSIKAGKKMIQDAEPLIKKVSNILHSETISDKLKDGILKYVIPYITPVLNNGLGKITKNFQTSETEKINVLDRINPRFFRELFTLGVDILSKALEVDLNPKVQEIYKNIKKKNESSQTAILQNIREIITSDQVAPILKKDLVKFIKMLPNNQKQLVQFTENIINNKVQKFVKPELIANTVGLLANSSEKLVESVPLAIDAFYQFKANGHWSNINLNMAGLTTENKKMLLAAQKPEVVKLVNNIKSIIDNLSPVLATELPIYWDQNKQNILDILKHPKVIEKIKSSGKDPEFIYKVAEASMPFVQDALPLITHATSKAFSDSDRTADIMQKVKLIKMLPKKEKKKEIKKLIGTLVELKNNNPEINKIIEKDIPKLLKKHANTLGPIVEEFLNKKPIGQELKLEGKKLVKIACDHAPEIIKIADKFTKREYGKIILPALKLLVDPKVLGLAAEIILKLCKLSNKNADNFTLDDLIEQNLKKLLNKNILNEELEDIIILVGMDKTLEKIDLIPNKNLKGIIEVASNEDLKKIVYNISDEKLQLILRLLSEEKIKQIMILTHVKEVIEQLEKQHEIESILYANKLDKISIKRLVDLINNISDENLANIIDNVSNQSLSIMLQHVSKEKAIGILTLIHGEQATEIFTSIYPENNITPLDTSLEQNFCIELTGVA